MPKKIVIIFDGDKTTVETAGYQGLTCLSELTTLDLPFKVESEQIQSNRGIPVGQQTKLRC